MRDSSIARWLLSRALTATSGRGALLYRTDRRMIAKQSGKLSCEFLRIFLSVVIALGASLHLIAAYNYANVEKGTLSTTATTASGQIAYKDGATVKNLVKTQGDTVHLYAIWQ